MRTVIQRVSYANVSVDGKLISSIKTGLLILLGVHREDTLKDVQYIVKKLSGLRIMEDSDGKTNISVNPDIDELLVVSQFTLYGNCKKGRRPSFSTSATSSDGQELYEQVVKQLKNQNFKVKTGVFGAYMEVELKNTGPYTILLDSKDMISF
ncbi:D-tyrosyl-tRNA(Tyr) deacylase [bacterium]|nr:D-tyrosyl-tRNA(Tyr) deacylase [bacterium]